MYQKTVCEKKERTFRQLLFLAILHAYTLEWQWKDDRSLFRDMDFEYSHSALATSIVRSVSLTGNSCGLGSSWFLFVAGILPPACSIILAPFRPFIIIVEPDRLTVALGKLKLQSRWIILYTLVNIIYIVYCLILI